MCLHTLYSFVCYKLEITEEVRRRVEPDQKGDKGEQEDGRALPQTTFLNRLVVFFLLVLHLNQSYTSYTLTHQS